MSPRTVMPPRPWIPALGVAQIEAIYSHEGSLMENVYHVLVHSSGASPSAQEMTALAQAVDTWELEQMLSVRSSHCALVMVRVRDLTVQGGEVVEYSPPGARVGGDASNPMPGNVTVAVKWGTARGGRSFRGRTYHIGLTVGNVGVQQLSAGAPESFQTKYTSLLTTLNAVNPNGFVVVSYAHNNAWRDAAVTTPIIRCSVDPFIDSQRRRLAGRGQ